MSRRLPAVAGQFYSASPSALQAEVTSCEDPSVGRQTALAVICPHAGLMYSGHVAGAVYSRIRLPETVIMIGPNHTGIGPLISVYPEGTWLIPGNELRVDQSLAKEILNRLPQAAPDEFAHRSEHCLEVQLPFLAHGRQDLHIVPIVLGTTDLDLCRQLGRCLAGILRERRNGEEPDACPLILATTDMTHYEPDQIAREQDALAIEAIEHVDPDRLHATVRTNRISMCGLGPAVTALEVARTAQVDRPSFVRYATSGDASGDFDRVVGYAGFIFPWGRLPA